MMNNLRLEASVRTLEKNVQSSPLNQKLPIMKASINIVQLPQVVLEKIFRMICHRRDLLTVCKVFYDTVCSVEQYKYKMKIITFTNYVRVLLEKWLYRYD